MDTNENFNGSTPKWKLISILIAIQLFFVPISFSLLLFYGPFESLKRDVVGTLLTTRRFPFVVKMFLSDQAISKIQTSEIAQDPTEKGEQINLVNFKENHTDKIEVYNIDGGDFVGKILLVYDPTRMILGYSSMIPKSGETTSVIAKRNYAIAAVNAGGFVDTRWVGTGGAPMGFIFHSGKLVYNEYSSEKLKQDTVAFTKKGQLIVGKHSVEELKKLGVVEGVTFGPPLIVNGKPTIKNGNGGWGYAPRTAIAQRKDGAVIMLAIDGRSLKSSGASLRDVQDILLKYGAINAVNLDGGSSTTLYMNGKIINTPSDALGERAVPTCFMVGSNKTLALQKEDAK